IQGRLVGRLGGPSTLQPPTGSVNAHIPYHIVIVFHEAVSLSATMLFIFCLSAAMVMIVTGAFSKHDLSRNAFVMFCCWALSTATFASPSLMEIQSLLSLSLISLSETAKQK
ncbi:hypothetical protein Tco_0101417, partial [Tanacetum coccineum]